MPEARGRGFKEKARHLISEKLDKLFETYQESENKPSSPKPPSFPASGSAKPSNPVNQLASGLNAISISNPTTLAAGHSSSNFIGGFNLAGASASSPTLDSTSRPPKMPVPQIPSGPLDQPLSLTMQMALDPDYSMGAPNYNGAIGFPRPPITPQKPLRPSKPSHRHSSSISSTSTNGGLSPSTSPTRPTNMLTPIRPSLSTRSSASQTSTVTSSSKTVQCSGITKAGKQCTRQVKVQLARDDAEDGEENVARFCYQHTDEILVPSGYYARKNGQWVLFEDWIPPYLSKSTQASLRAEMEKTKSVRDVPGYIYTFEIRDPDVTKTIKLKVGRAVNLVKRIDQWGKQCGSKEQVLRGFYPGNVEEVESSLMKGRVQAGPEKAAWCHRLERLVHIELADLVSSCVYLEPGWPRIQTPPSSPSATPTTGRGRSKSNVTGNGNTKPCPDCSNMHKEIFEFKRWEKGKNKGKEWELIIKPVVERWGRFVDLYV